ncbi:LOB domain-containing protein 1-like [Phragmites australis]|uniref:LOB domain-containing protein 1-like n=1 Tax=Phragmites australis TaxID=29695 RepID=UPI002D78F5AA|nr:LOB domain-containing protein 1-like [Phragmites australis]
MDSSCDTACTAAATLPHGASSPPTQPQPAVVLSPCAACKILRRRCVDRCVLAPYFPPTEPHKFATAHRVFGASNIIKLLQELPEEQRADAVSSMVYEASARIRDPVYGCAGAICQLQKQVSDLKAQLARAHAELAGSRAQHAHLLALLCVEVAAGGHLASPAYCAAMDYSSQLVVPTSQAANALYVVDGLQASPVGWADEPLWT